MKIHLVTLGCPKNVVGSEYLKGGLSQNSIRFIDEPDQADVIIINTCAFILSAREEAIEAILEAVQLKQSGNVQRVFVVGCLPQKYQTELQTELPEVDAFFDQLDFKIVAQRIAQNLDYHSNKNVIRDLITPKHYAYLKIAEGCNNRCNYCTIPSIKGGYRSKDLSELIAEAKLLIDNGVRELIVIAQDSTYYGRDLKNGVSLTKLLQHLVAFNQLKWIRLLYAHPAHVEDELIELLKTETKVCKYVDLPIQHISDSILKRMNRKVTSGQIKKLIEKLRKEVPGIAIRTTVMVGFPGETDHDFMELTHLIEGMRFERLGIFKYSQEDDTVAAKLADQIDERIKEDRFQQLMELQQEIAFDKNQKLINATVEVIVDEFDDDENCFIARTQWDSPLIDNRVLIDSGVTVGSFYSVRIIDAMEHDLKGSVISN